MITLAIATFALGALIVPSPAITLGKMVKKAVKKEVNKQIAKKEGPSGKQGLAGQSGAAGAPATALFAAVNADGTMDTQKGVVGTIAHTAASGSYTITFDRNVEVCVPIASVSEDDPGIVQASTVGGANNTVDVFTRPNDGGALADNAFGVAVLC